MEFPDTFIVPNDPRYEILINKNGCLAMVIRGWMSKEYSDHLFNYLIENVPWEQHRTTAYGGHDQPRLLYAFGEPDNKGNIRKHKYSGSQISINPWIIGTKEIYEKIEKELKLKFNSCLMNYYRNGSDYISYHADKEVNSENMYAVLTNSLGGSCDFDIRSIKPDINGKKTKIRTQLNHGDAFLMLGNTQKIYEHGISKRAKRDPRISLTWRLLHF